MVTYTYTVTNGGTAPLSAVMVTDTSCAPVTYVSGDTNLNTLLDVPETWTFNCTATITVTTTNTATAQGIDPSGGVTVATDQATVTVAGCPPTVPNCTPPPTCPPGTTNPNCPTPTPCLPAVVPNCQPLPATLCVLKFNDLNGNGYKAATEPVLGGVTFTILPAVGPAQTTPATTGQVCWTVPPGTYTITESGPLTTGSWVPSTPVLSPSRSQTVTVVAGQSITLRFGDHRFRIDHFECYTVTPQGAFPLFSGIGLKDQFGTRSVIAATRITLCNPVQKTLKGAVTRVTNPLAHLVCYQLPKPQAPVPAPTSRVSVTNQFGTSVLQVLAPFALCLPSGKSLTDQDQKVPTTLDHYLCYPVKDVTPFARRSVTLADEFGVQSVQVVVSGLLCNPVQKTYQGTTTRVLDAVDHLVCYLPAPLSYVNRRVWISNQFEKVPLQAVHRLLLCVPSVKHVLPPTVVR
jgi:uncharacterized repeat protein (TIGR01451 family)